MVAVSPQETQYIDQLKNTFRYYVDEESGHVDWNRDGEFAPAGVTAALAQDLRRFERGDPVEARPEATLE